MPTTFNGKFLWGPSLRYGFDDVWGSYSLNDADNSVAGIFCIPRDGTIDYVGVNIGTIVGNPPAYNIGIVTVDTSGNPTTTAYGGAVSATHDFTATGWHWIALATPATAVTGDIVAVRLWPTGSAPDGSNYVTVLCANTYTRQSIPAVLGYGVTWNLNAGQIGLDARYDDGNNILMSPISLSIAVGNDHTPDEVGAMFTVPFDCRCIGAKIALGNTGDNADFTLKLYNAANSVLASLAVDISKANMASATCAVGELFWSPVNLSRDTDYRLTILPTTTNHVLIQTVEMEDLFSRWFLHDGGRWIDTRRTDAGAWTEDINKVPVLALVLDQITVRGAA